MKSKMKHKVVVLLVLSIAVVTLSSCVWASMPNYQSGSEHRAALEAAGDTQGVEVFDFGYNNAPLCWGIGVLCLLYSAISRLSSFLPPIIIVDIIGLVTALALIIA